MSQQAQHVRRLWYRDFDMAHLYISHSAVDLDPLLKLHEALRRAGISAWYPSSPDAAANTDLVREKMDEAFAVAVLSPNLGPNGYGNANATHADVHDCQANSNLLPFRSPGSSVVLRTRTHPRLPTH